MPSPYSRWYCALSQSKNLCLAHTRELGHRNVVRGGDFSVTRTGGVPTLTLLPSVGRRNKHTRSKQRAQNPTAKSNGDNYITSSFTICIPNTELSQVAASTDQDAARETENKTHSAFPLTIPAVRVSTAFLSMAFLELLSMHSLFRTFSYKNYPIPFNY